MEKENVPKPGSQEAIDKGCSCPVVDNHYGKGIEREDGTVDFWFTFGCVLHTPRW